MLTDERLQRVVRAYQAFKAEPGFTRVVPMKETLAKEGNLSIPLLVGGERKAQTDALAGWLKSSAEIRNSLSSPVSAERDQNGRLTIVSNDTI